MGFSTCCANSSRRGSSSYIYGARRTRGFLRLPLFDSPEYSPSCGLRTILPVSGFRRTGPVTGLWPLSWSVCISRGRRSSVRGGLFLLDVSLLAFVRRVLVGCVFSVYAFRHAGASDGIE